MVQLTALLEAGWSRDRLRPLGVVPFHEIAIVPVQAVLPGVIGAGSLGSIDAGLDGPYDCPDAVRAYAVPLVGLEFFVKYLLTVAFVSLVATPLVVNLGLPGAVIGELIISPRAGGILRANPAYSFCGVSGNCIA